MRLELTFANDRVTPASAGREIHCLDCDYNLHGLTEHRCPECGREFDPADCGTFRREGFPHPLRTRSAIRQCVVAAGLVWMSLIVLVLALTVGLPWRWAEELLAAGFFVKLPLSILATVVTIFRATYLLRGFRWACEQTFMLLFSLPLFPLIALSLASEMNRELKWLRAQQQGDHQLLADDRRVFGTEGGRGAEVSESSQQGGPDGNQTQADARKQGSPRACS